MWTVEGRGTAALLAPHDPLLLHGKELSLGSRQLILIQTAVVGLHWVWARGLSSVLDLVLGLLELLTGVDHTGVVCHQLLHLQGHTCHLLGLRAALFRPTWLPG